MNKTNNISILVLAVLTVLPFSSICSQEQELAVKLQYQITLRGRAFEKNESNEKNALKIETCQFYLSNFVLLKNDTEVWREANSHHLLIEDYNESLTIPLYCPDNVDFDAIQFLLGIDSITNVSGAYGGDLDPTKGMYWAWNSGYINFKLEGKDTRCPTRNNQFQFHLGGYLPPFSAAQEIRLNVKKSKKIDILVELSTFFTDVDLSKLHTVMSPSAKAKKLSVIAASMFSIDDK